MIKYQPGKRNVITDVLLRKEILYIDKSHKITILLKIYLDKGVLLAYLVPMTLEEPVLEELAEIVNRVKESNR